MTQIYIVTQQNQYSEHVRLVTDNNERATEFCRELNAQTLPSTVLGMNNDIIPERMEQLVENDDEGEIVYATVVEYKLREELPEREEW